MRKLILLFVYLMVISSCSWFGSKSSQDTVLLDAEVELLEDEDSSVLKKDIKSLSDSSIKGEGDLADIEDEELDSGEDQLDGEGDNLVQLNEGKLNADEITDEITDDELDQDEDEEIVVADSSKQPIDDSVVEQVEVNKEGITVDKLDSSDDFVEESDLATPADASAKVSISAEENDDFSQPESSEITDNSFEESVAPVKTYISVKKIRTSPYVKDGILVNAVYLAREGDSLKSVSNKIYSIYKKTQLLQINPHLRKYKTLPVGTKVYYSSVSRSSDNTNLLTYYEEQNIEPQVYTTVDGDNLRKLGKKLLGHSRSWQELWATNVEVESKAALPVGLNIRYWDQLSFERQAQKKVEEVQRLAEEKEQVQVKEQEAIALALKQKKAEEERLRLGAVADQKKLEKTEVNNIVETGQGKVEEAGGGKKAVAESVGTPSNDMGTLAQEKGSAGEVESGKVAANAVAGEVEDSSAKVVEAKVPQNKKRTVSLVPQTNKGQGFLGGALSMLEDDLVLYTLMGLFLLIIIFLFMRKKKVDVEEPYSDQEFEALDDNTAMFLGGEKKESLGGGGSVVDATQMDATQMDATQMDATQMDATQMDATQMDATQMSGVDIEGSSLLLGDDDKKVSG